MDKNQEKILQELKKRIAINNFEKDNLIQNEFPTDFLVDWRRCFMNKKKILSMASLFIAVVVLVGVTKGINAKMQWEVGFKEFEAEPHSLDFTTVKDADESGYTEYLDMNYIIQDGIGIRLTSLLMTDEYFELTADFQFPEDMDINTETFCYGYVIYDENKNVYTINRGINAYSGRNEGILDTYTPKMYEKLGIDYDRNDLYNFFTDAGGASNVCAKDHHIISKIKEQSSKGFPKSKKLFVLINRLGYTMVEPPTEEGDWNYTEDFYISNKEWLFEIDVPEKFYNRRNIDLTLKDEIPDLEVEKINVTEVYLSINGDLKGFSSMLDEKSESVLEMTELLEKAIYITDEDGNIYYPKHYGMNGIDGVVRRYEITKNMLNKIFFLNVVKNGNLYTSELIEK